VDRTSAEQIAHLLGLLEQWLAGADPDATNSCAQTCSLGQSDAFTVAAWVATLVMHLHDRIDTADGRGVDSWS
jgi:hypothetical protein